MDENRTGDVLKTCKSLFQKQAVGKKLRAERPVGLSVYHPDWQGLLVGHSDLLF